MSELQKELRLGNYLQNKKGELVLIERAWQIDEGEELIPIPLTKENIEKYIDWGFEYGFNKSVVEKEYWIEYQFLMENAIDGSSSFEIIFSESKQHPVLTEITYYIDDKLLEFGIDDTLHNLQNLFYISSGQELPINKY